MAGPLASAAPLELCSTAQEGWFEGTFSLRLSFSNGDESQKSKHGVVGAESRRRHGTGATRTDRKPRRREVFPHFTSNTAGGPSPVVGTALFVSRPARPGRVRSRFRFEIET